MPDRNFFKRGRALTLAQIAAITGAEIGPGGNPERIIEDVAPLDGAGPADLSFFDNVKYRGQLTLTKAGACIMDPDFAALAPAGVGLLFSSCPYKAYALAAQAFYPEAEPEEAISDMARIDPSAVIGRGCKIEAGAVISPKARIGDGCWIEANAVIGTAVTLGKSCRIGANASVSHAILGDNVRLYPGVRVGQDGFGFAIDPAGHVKVPQLGRVIIEDNVEIGANTTVDRGSGPDTIIGRGSWIDNLVQIGHNVKIGRGCIVVAQAGISGSTVLEDFAALGGQAGIAGHLKIGKGARVAAQSGVMRDIPPGEEHMGSPAMPSRQYMRQVAMLKRLIKKEKTS
jgi:UDP-3-O-[3-hydroxymyristoyl] glucosamine N-acyltransferase